MEREPYKKNKDDLDMDISYYEDLLNSIEGRCASTNLVGNEDHPSTHYLFETCEVVVTPVRVNNNILDQNDRW